MTGSNAGPPRCRPPSSACSRVDAGEPPGVPDDVDRARVPAAGEHDQAAAADVHDQRLVVDHERVVRQLSPCQA